MLGKFEENDNQVYSIWMSDEAHLSDFVNKQNFRYWSDANFRLFHETPLHSQIVTLWYAISQNEIIGPFFSKVKIEIWEPLIMSGMLQ